MRTQTQAGISRSAAFTTAHLMAARGLSRDDALAVVKAGRSKVRPNDGFMAMLAEYEEWLKVMVDDPIGQEDSGDGSAA